MQSLYSLLAVLTAIASFLLMAFAIALLFSLQPVVYHRVPLFGGFFFLGPLVSLIVKN